MSEFISVWFLYITLPGTLIVGLVYGRLCYVRKRGGLRGLEAVMEQFKDDKEFVEYTQQQLEIARNKPFWKF